MEISSCAFTLLPTEVNGLNSNFQQLPPIGVVALSLICKLLGTSNALTHSAIQR